MGLDLLLLDPTASVADLMEAFEPYAGVEGALHKRHLGRSAPCCGCRQNCCTTSIVIPDPIAFAAVARRLALDEAELLRSHCDHETSAAGVPSLVSRPCTFLAPDDTCSIYRDRSLICRAFICCPYTEPLQDLIHNILGAGLAALTARLHAAELLPPVSGESLAAIYSQSAYHAEFSRFLSRWIRRETHPGDDLPPAWYVNPFQTARTYHDLPLAAFLPPPALSRLTRSALP